MIFMIFWLKNREFQEKFSGNTVLTESRNTKNIIALAWLWHFLSINSRFIYNLMGIYICVLLWGKRWIQTTVDLLSCFMEQKSTFAFTLKKAIYQITKEHKKQKSHRKGWILFCKRFQSATFMCEKKKKNRDMK